MGRKRPLHQHNGNNDEGWFKTEATALDRRLRNGTVRIEAHGPSSLRVRAAENTKIRDDLPWALLPSEELPSYIIQSTIIRVTETEGQIRHWQIEARIKLNGGTITFCNTEIGEEVLAEKTDVHIWIPPRMFHPVSADTWKVDQYFAAYEDEKIYGLGQHQHGYLSISERMHRGSDAAQRTGYHSIPCLLARLRSPLEQARIGRVELAKNHTRWSANQSVQLDYWITVGTSYADIMSHHVDCTGHAPELPYYASARTTGTSPVPPRFGGATTFNISPLMNAKGLYDGMNSSGQNQVLTLNRPVVGRSPAIRAGLIVGMSGIPWWTRDIGGFIHGNIKALRTSHPTRALSTKSLVLWGRSPARYYTAQMALASKTGSPIMRPLFFDYSNVPTPPMTNSCLVRTSWLPAFRAMVLGSALFTCRRLLPGDAGLAFVDGAVDR
ncbi:hypothetical protein DFJ77DRAFT_538840 [Powellomyces hirtus]|nr:hypothetical protein DFJ77DRAFT_538840 [Powellomyces hirtus]